MSRQNRWFQPGDGIAREVITADIQRYLGPDALVRPGDDNGVQGFWITAYRTLTTQMVRDLQADSARWRAEDATRRVAYTDSSTHSYRQEWGPSQQQQPPPDRGYATPHAHAHARPSGSSHAHGGYAQNYYPQDAGDHGAYTHAPPHAYAPTQAGMPSYSHQQPPRQPQYAGFAPDASRAPVAYPTGAHAPPAYYAARPGYPQQQTAPSAPPPGYYIASDGNQYPVASLPPAQDGRGRR